MLKDEAISTYQILMSKKAEIDNRIMEQQQIIEQARADLKDVGSHDASENSTLHDLHGQITSAIAAIGKLEDQRAAYEDVADYDRYNSTGLVLPYSFVHFRMSWTIDGKPNSEEYKFFIAPGNLSMVESSVISENSEIFKVIQNSQKGSIIAYSKGAYKYDIEILDVY